MKKITPRRRLITTSFGVCIDVCISSSRQGNSELKHQLLSRIDIIRRIIGCQTVKELANLERLFILSDYEQDLEFERKNEIITAQQQQQQQQQLRLMANLMDSWRTNEFPSFWTIGTTMNGYGKRLVKRLQGTNHHHHHNNNKSSTMEIINNTRGGIQSKIWERANGGQI